MATALTALATTTLASASATVTFSSISGAYRDLYVVADIVASGQYLNMRINSDTGANYSNVTAYGTGSGTGSYAAASNTFVGFSSLLVASTPVTHLINFLDYAQTDKHKTLLTRMGSPAGSSNVAMQANRWASTSAITSLSFYRETGGNLEAGTTISLYGVSA